MVVFKLKASKSGKICRVTSPGLHHQRITDLEKKGAVGLLQRDMTESVMIVRVPEKEHRPRVDFIREEYLGK